MRRFRAWLLTMVCAWLGADADSRADHWAYQPPSRPALPGVALDAWPRNAIDYFTRARMELNDLQPTDEANKRTLIRRVTFDITGLPPTRKEVDAFLADTRPRAFHRLVDRLLASPRYGERMASMWLDLARYADTHGYHMDAHRDMWRWRDWVIDAYNCNMPFDQFTIEQLAGDLLPNVTLSQRIATGFNRNNMVNFENGIIAEEFRSEYVIDRVVTTSTAWLGQTMTCARCHDHKYDPFTQRDFYRFYAFFNNVPENGVDGDKGNAVPFIKAPTPLQAAELKRLGSRTLSLEAAMQDRFESVDEDVRAWAVRKNKGDTRKLTAKPVLHMDLDQAPPNSGTIKVPGPVGSALLFRRDVAIDAGDHAKFERNDPFAISLWVFPTTTDKMVVLSRGNANGTDRGYSLQLDDLKLRMQIIGDDGTSLQFESKAPLDKRKWQHIAVSYDGSGKAVGITLFLSGKRLDATTIADEPQEKSRGNHSFWIGDQHRENSFRGMLDELRVYAGPLTAAEVEVLAGGDPIADILAKKIEERTAADREQLTRYYLKHVDTDYRRLDRDLASVNQQMKAVMAKVPTTMVMQELAETRATHVLVRGRYDQLGDLVTAGVPKVLPPLGVDGDADRLDLARWLVQPDHPLTARVAVNHLWQQFFGKGLVRTPDDFGTRGEPPTHPALLDWLATEFARDWDMKGLVKLMVTSATYRQSSHVTVELLDRDPENRWLARASSLRLPAEMIRDNALVISGLLVEQTGGPSVFPYQPPRLWEELSYNANDFTAQVFRQSRGQDLYRRSLYTFWKRSVPSPTLAAFDAQSREVCVAKRPRTNTVEQALVLMNDVTFVEAARAFAERVLREAATTDERFVVMFQSAASRDPSQKELKTLSGLMRDLLAEYEHNSELAEQLVSAGESRRSEDLNTTELAAWTAIANVILSLDEVTSRN